MSANTSRFFSAPLSETDPELFRAIGGELTRQRDEIELIASENIVSRAVLDAAGSVLTNKYAEGYSGRRYYGGCKWVDVAEDHDAEGGFSGQNYFPDDMDRQQFYVPKDTGFEREIAKRLEYWSKLRNKRQGGE